MAVFGIVHIAMANVEQSIDLRYTELESVYITTTAVAGLICAIWALVCILIRKYADFGVALMMFYTMHMGVVLFLGCSNGMPEPAPPFMLALTIGMACAGAIGWLVASFSNATEPEKI